MSDSDTPSSPSTLPAQRLARHLANYPHDLIDARALMVRFRATPEDFRSAFCLLDAARPPSATPAEKNV